MAYLSRFLFDILLLPVRMHFMLTLPTIGFFSVPCRRWKPGSSPAARPVVARVRSLAEGPSLFVILPRLLALEYDTQYLPLYT